MVNPPLVIIVVPTMGGRGEHLSLALKSLLAQTYPNLELILVDNASKDDTRSLASSINDHRFSYVRHEDCLGMAENWNRALRIALERKPVYVGLFHDDDLYSPKLLEREVNFLEENKRAGLVYPAFHYYNEEEKRYSLRRPYNDDRLMTATDTLNDLCFYGKYFIATPAVLARREAHEIAGAFDTTFRICPDLDLWWRMAEYYDIGYINEPLYIHTVHKAQVSSSTRAAEDAISQGELKRVLDKALERISSSRKDFNVRKYQNLISRHCAKQSLIAAKDAILSGDFSLAYRSSEGAAKLSDDWDVRFGAAILRNLANPMGRLLCLLAIKPLRFLRGRP